VSLVRQILEKATKGATKGAKPFYSAVDKAILDIVEKQPKATGDQYLGMILKAKGVKPAEIKDRGIDAALKGKGKMIGKDLVKTAEERPAPQITGRTLYEDVDEGVSPNVYYGKEEYGEYRTPGGQNYREILISLPQEKVSVKPITAQDLMDQGYEVRNFEYDPKANKSSFKIYDKDGNLASYRKNVPGVAYPEQALIYQAQDMSNVAYKEANKPLYKAPHYGQQGENLLAHARVQDMRGPNGEKILLIDEIQSDWHQAGRKKGYSSPEERQYLVDKMARNEELTPKEEALRLKYLKGDMPQDAPFKKNWHELVMKRLVDDAAKGGYDRVIFPPGAEQARRYDLSKQVDKIVWHEETGTLGAQRAGGDTGTIKFENVTAEKLADYVGEDAAKKLTQAQDLSGWRTIEGEDLRVGGKGMRGFYDTMLPSYIKKQYGVDVGQHPVKVSDFDVVRENRGEGFAVIRPGGGTVAKYPTIEEAQAAASQMNEVPYHSFDITPEIRESITTQGQPLYQIAPVAGAVGAGMMATDEEVPQYKKGGPVSMDAMRLAVLNKRLRK